ncbi:unnamed protein product [Mesocestoides corti]|uniref:Conserved Oligomeric Golgi complex subunit 6 C-terminal domain-containing protein n=1 Tax=Mesocestoides corti TaxID=53468 RepID=A0A0R3U531_MESCO|nr:unnamed protein product [Mesocestoides corti]
MSASCSKINERLKCNKPLRCILDEYANARRQVIVEAFLSALTVGWDKGGGTFVTPSSKPIEMQSHDPTRYAGDMLAWLHQAAASEKEYLLSLTSENADKDIIYDCLNSITSGLTHPLQLRLEQMLVTEHNPVLLYKVNNLLQFYSNVVMNLMGQNCTLYTTLSDLQLLSWNLFVSALQRQTSELLADTGPPHHELLPSMSAMDVTRLLEAILTAQDMSCALPDVRKAKCEEIVSIAVTPLLQHFEIMARRFITNDNQAPDQTVDPTILPPEAYVYLVNCLHALHNALSRLEFTGAQIAALAARLEEVMSCLTQLQAAHAITRAGLYCLNEAISTPSEVPLADRGPGCSQPEVINAFRAFNTVYLSGPDAWELPETSQIAFPRPRNALRRRTADLVHSVYSILYRAITDPTSGYTSPWPEDLRTPEQVAELLLPSS